MRGIGAALCFLILTGAPFLASNRRRQDSSRNIRQTENSLVAHIEIARQTYCHVDDESFGANIDLKLRLTNASDRTVILARKIEPPGIIRVARDAEAAQRNEFLFNPDILLGPVAELPPAPVFGKTPNPKLFVLLRKGESFETTTQTAVFAIEDSAKPQPGMLGKGASYLLQVGFWTWPYQYPYFDSKTETPELKRRWSSLGDLSAGILYSDFVSFTLPQQIENPPCPTTP